MTNYDFFVSYTGTDRDYAEWLVFTLESAGYLCVYQARDFVPGENFMEQMRQASSGSKTTLALLSPGYLTSEFAQLELDGALASDPRGKKGRLLPVRVRDCLPDPLLMTRVWVDLVGCSPADAAKRLLAGVKAFKIGVRQDGDGYFEKVPEFPVQPSPPPVVRKDLSPSTDVRVAFLAASVGLVGIDLEQEAKIIRDAVPANLKDRVSIQAIFDVAADDFYTVLNDMRPQIVHFAGSFLKTGEMALDDGAGGFRKVDVDAAAAMFRCLSDGVDLVVLNACFSAECARQLAPVVGAAIGIEGEIADRDAITFSKTFYTALWRGRSIAESHEQGCTRLVADSVTDDAVPKLYSAAQIDTDKPLVHAPS